MPSLVVPARFNGPPRSGNGGWTAGALATLLTTDPGACVTVRLRRPPPLETPMAVEVDADRATARSPGGDRDAMVLEATASDAADVASLASIPPVPVEVARAAAAAYRGAVDHPFPTCFSCGPLRGDGLGLTPAPLPDQPDVTACAWTPEQDADVPITWAALDCPGGWSVDLAGRPMVLGTMSAVVHRTPTRGEACVVMGRSLEQSGRKARTATTLWSGDELLAQATATWIGIDPGSFAALRSAE